MVYIVVVIVKCGSVWSWSWLICGYLTRPEKTSHGCLWFTVTYQYIICKYIHIRQRICGIPWYLSMDTGYQSVWIWVWISSWVSIVLSVLLPNSPSCAFSRASTFLSCFLSHHYISFLDTHDALPTRTSKNTFPLLAWRTNSTWKVFLFLQHLQCFIQHLLHLFPSWRVLCLPFQHTIHIPFQLVSLHLHHLFHLHKHQLPWSQCLRFRKPQVIPCHQNLWINNHSLLFRQSIHTLILSLSNHHDHDHPYYDHYLYHPVPLLQSPLSLHVSLYRPHHIPSYAFLDILAYRDVLFLFLSSLHKLPCQWGCVGPMVLSPHLSISGHVSMPCTYSAFPILSSTSLV